MAGRMQRGFCHGLLSPHGGVPARRGFGAQPRAGEATLGRSPELVKPSPLALAGGSGRSPELVKPSPLATAGGSGRSPELVKPSPLATAGGLGRSELVKPSPLAGSGRSPEWKMAAVSVAFAYAAT